MKGILEGIGVSHKLGNKPGRIILKIDNFKLGEEVQKQLDKRNAKAILKKTRDPIKEDNVTWLIRGKKVSVYID